MGEAFAKQARECLDPAGGMSEKLLRTCDGCGKELALPGLHVILRAHAGGMRPAMEALDFCNYGCAMEYFGTQKKSEKPAEVHSTA